MEETLLHRARLCLFLPPLPSFSTSLAATLRSAATNAGPRHQLQQRIISVVINGDALGNCYRAARSLPPCNRALYLFPMRGPDLFLLLLLLLPVLLSFSIHFAPLPLVLFSPRHFALLQNCIPSIVRPRPAPTESSRDASLSVSRFNCLSMSRTMPPRRAISTERSREEVSLL